MAKLEEIDRNFAANEITYEGMITYNVRKAPFRLDGLYRPEDGESFRRLPKEVAEATNEGVAVLSRHTAGGYLSFRTDATRIRLTWFLPSVDQMPHMPLSGSSSFDLYADGRYRGFFRSAWPQKGKNEAEIALPGGKMQDIEIYFPLYNAVDDVAVSLNDDAKVEAPKPYALDLPVVFYGSSITQGGCASHAGNAYPSMIGRVMNLSIVNLGFSGSCRAEKSMADYLGTLPMAAFVYDYDHNAPTAEFLAQTHASFLETFRQYHSEVPVLMVSSADLAFGIEREKRREIIRKTCEEAVARGDRNVYFLDGEQIYAEVGLSLCTVDGTHPNDLGFYQMAKHIGAMLKTMLFTKG